MAFTALDVKKLREMTNVGMMDCKKALQATDGDMDAAVDWLREKGLAKAAKKADRVAAEGVAYAAVVNGIGVVIEVNSETDFAAKTDAFMDLVKNLAVVVATENPADVDALKACKYPGSDHAGEGHVHRREHADPPLRPFCRQHLRCLRSRGRHPRRSGESGRGGRH